MKQEINKIGVDKMFNELIDVKEEKLLSIDTELLSILLKDNSSGKNIIWATADYQREGVGFEFESEITINKITGIYKELIKPRSKKSKKEQEARSRNNAEVFTPSWICNKQNNLVDEAWFGKKNIFNTSLRKKWITNSNKIEFDKYTWQDYIKSTRLEISCGEAPYLTSRYDTVTGKSIKVEDRIGLLDRKLRIVSENNNYEEDWIKWSIIAVKSVYGFDWQGDNVLLARENLLYTYIDYYYKKFNRKPDLKLIKDIANIISWNIWQMDGLKYVIPNSCKDKKITEITLFGDVTNECRCVGCKTGDNKKHNGVYCKIMNWDTNRKVKFETLLKKK